MLFSVLIPVHNAEDYLVECIESVLCQGSGDFEIILADDCSTDRSLEICLGYEKAYPEIVRVIHNEENLKLLLTRRKLFNEARGEWIISVDADDSLSEGALELIKNTIEEFRGDLVLYNAKCIHMDGSIENINLQLQDRCIYGENDKSEIYREMLLTNRLNSMCFKAVKRDLIDKDVDYTWWSELTIGEDAFQTYPIIDRAERITYIAEELYIYRKNEGGMTSKPNTNLYEMRKLLWSRADLYMNKWDISDEIKEQVYIRRINELIQIIHNKYDEFNGGKDFIDFLKKLNKDDILKMYFTNISISKLRKRYAFCCKMILIEKYLWVKQLCKAERFLINLKYRKMRG